MTQFMDAETFKKQLQKKTKRKYSNEKIEIDGHIFDSKKEGRRYGELKIMQAAGVISNFQIHPSYKLHINGQFLCTYKGDFFYTVTANGDSVLEDTKGVKTTAYRLKKKLMKILLDIDILET